MDLAASQYASAIKAILFHVTLLMDGAIVTQGGLGKSALYVRILKKSSQS